MSVERLFAHHVSLSIEGVGCFEMYTLPNDGSQVIVISSPIHPDGALAFQWNPQKVNWILVDLEDKEYDPSDEGRHRPES